MRIRSEICGRTSGHAAQPPTDVRSFTVDGAPGWSVSVWSLGATLHRVRVPDRNGDSHDVTVSLPTVARYEDRSATAYIGCTMGRYARCVGGARFTLDGIEHVLDPNAPPHHIHGGTYGFDRFVWDADAEVAGGEAVVRLRIDRPDGDQGYPGRFTALAHVVVSPDRRLSLEYRATTTAPTIVGLTNHSYWNLGAAAIDGLDLAIRADRVLLVDDDLLPIGEPVAVDGTALDFRLGKRIGDARLDNCFVLDGPAGEEPVVELRDPATGRSMRVRTDQPGLQVFSGDNLPRPRSGLCLQTGGWPDAPNRPTYPSARLDPDETYVHRVTYEFP